MRALGTLFRLSSQIEALMSTGIGFLVKNLVWRALKPLTQLSFFFLVLAQWACSDGITVRSTFDQQAPFEQYQTFAMLLPNRPVATENVDISPFMMQKLRQMAHNELKTRGFVPAAKDTAELLVAVMAGTKRRIETNSTPGYSGYGYGGPGWSYSVDDYLEGTLVIDLIDRKTESVVWRGSGKTRISSDSPDARLAQVVAAVLAQFPPPGFNTVNSERADAQPDSPAASLE